MLCLGIRFPGERGICVTVVFLWHLSDISATSNVDSPESKAKCQVSRTVWTGADVCVCDGTLDVCVWGEGGVMCLCKHVCGVIVYMMCICEVCVWKWVYTDLHLSVCVKLDEITLFDLRKDYLLFFYLLIVVCTQITFSFLFHPSLHFQSIAFVCLTGTWGNRNSFNKSRVAQKTSVLTRTNPNRLRSSHCCAGKVPLLRQSAQVWPEKWQMKPKTETAQSPHKQRSDLVTLSENWLDKRETQETTMRKSRRV